MRIDLIIPPASYLISGKVFPPLGILYTASLLEKQNHEIKVIDLLNGEDWHKKVIQSVMSKPDYIGITATTPDFPMALAILKEIKKVNPSQKVIIGGPHSKIAPKECKRYFDMTGDEFFSELGITKEFDEFPLPARHLIDLKSYSYKINEKEATNVIGQLGCPYSCRFCCKVHSLKKRNIPDIIGELDMLNKQYGYSAFMFYDDEINLDKSRLKELCNKLKERDYTWRCFIRSSLFDEKMAKEMSEAGCVEVLCGIESGSDKILEILNKQTTSIINSEARAICKKHGIRFKALTMIGLPSETKEDIMLTKKWLIDNKPDDFDITIFMPYPGSDIYKNRDKYDIDFHIDYSRDVTFYKGIPRTYKSFVRNSHLSFKEIVELREMIEKEAREVITQKC